MARKAIGTKRRFEIFKRDGFTCQYCGAHPPGALLQVDHITAVANGGTNDDDNLITSCQTCNIGKGARDLSAVPQSLAEKAKEVAEREAQIRGYSAIMAARRERIEDDCWKVVAELYPNDDPSDLSVDRRWLHSIRRFVIALGVDECIEAMQIAQSQGLREYNCFRYFCGVCWRKIKQEPQT